MFLLYKKNKNNENYLNDIVFFMFLLYKKYMFIKNNENYLINLV